MKVNYGSHEIYYAVNSRVAPRTLTSSDTSLPTVLIATMLRDNTSWSNDRTIESYLDLIASWDYPTVKISFALLVSSKVYFDELEANVAAAMRKRGFRHVTMIHRDVPIEVPYEYRHEFKYQKERRRTLARLRNLLLYSALRSEQAVLWFDADVTEAPRGLLKRVATSGKDIVAVRNMWGANAEYDLNTWKGTRIKPNATQLEAIAKGELFVPRPDKVQFLKQFAKEGVDWVEVDSVGATFLWVNSLAHKEGVMFTTSYIIGSEWEREGYDAIESEGLCYTAKFLGYTCWGLASEFTFHASNALN